MTRPHSLDPLTDRCPLIRGVLDRGQQVVAGEAAWCLDEIAALRDALVAAETERDDNRQRLAEIHGQLADKTRGNFAQWVREGLAAEHMAKPPSGGTYILGTDGRVSVIKLHETGQEGGADT